MTFHLQFLFRLQQFLYGNINVSTSVCGMEHSLRDRVWRDAQEAHRWEMRVEGRVWGHDCGQVQQAYAGQRAQDPA